MTIGGRRIRLENKRLSSGRTLYRTPPFSLNFSGFSDLILQRWKRSGPLLPSVQDQIITAYYGGSRTPSQMESRIWDSISLFFSGDIWSYGMQTWHVQNDGFVDWKPVGLLHLLNIWCLCLIDWRNCSKVEDGLVDRYAIGEILITSILAYYILNTCCKCESVSHCLWYVSYGQFRSLYHLIIFENIFGQWYQRKRPRSRHVQCVLLVILVRLVLMN